ncbi:hypothetical protein [Magnetospirillum molischianum]|uniref:Uncharacterized protein n=1 Tax=Magnetospirillum molischianum DSM 120 TaxID=1150626 RepID=H8FUM8_MAGML|nr:hypothetical protein [Magnetospirillum molischianum]CCG42066.1 conserved hypothetical protein [Magnetospirillum molischianum DSM 120]
MGDTMTATPDTAMAVFRVNLALQGPVVDILGQFLPELNVLPRDRAYDHIMDNLGLLTRCFDVFRREPERFRTILVDERKRPVTDESVKLSCGRSLGEVIAMVVRTAAKRFFRRTLPPTPRVSEIPNRADELYDSIKAYLLHDWQVPLVPTYAGMEPSLVRRIGARLLEAREAASLARLIADPDARLTEPLPPQTDRTEFNAISGTTLHPKRRHPMTAHPAEILCENQERLRPEAFTPVFFDPEVRATVPNPDNVRAIADILRGVGSVSALALVEGLGLRKDQLAVMLVVAHDCIGTIVFGRLFGPRADPELLDRILARARLHGIGPNSGVIECAIFMRSVFARFGHRSRRDP